MANSRTRPTTSFAIGAMIFATTTTLTVSLPVNAQRSASDYEKEALERVRRQKAERAAAEARAKQERAEQEARYKAQQAAIEAEARRSQLQIQNASRAMERQEAAERLKRAKQEALRKEQEQARADAARKQALVKFEACYRDLEDRRLLVDRAIKELMGYFDESQVYHENGISDLEREAKKYYLSYEFDKSIDLLERNKNDLNNEMRWILTDSYVEKTDNNMKIVIPDFDSAYLFIGKKPKIEHMHMMHYVNGMRYFYNDKHDKSIKSLIKSYNLGNPKAAYKLSVLYNNTRKTNKSESFQWLIKSANMGYIPAKYSLAYDLSQKLLYDRSFNYDPIVIANIYYEAIKKDEELYVYKNSGHPLLAGGSRHPIVVYLDKLESYNPSSAYEVAFIIFKTIAIGMNSYKKDRKDGYGFDNGMAKITYKLSKYHRFGVGTKKDIYKYYAFREISNIFNTDSNFVKSDFENDDKIDPENKDLSLDRCKLTKS